MDKGKEIFEQWRMKREQIEREAKANGIWQEYGFDSNNHLFKDIDNETKEKLEDLKIGE